MAPELSSNWKKLQATFKQEKPTKKPTSERQQNTLAKRKRLEGKTQILGQSTGGFSLPANSSSQRRKMESYISTAAERPTKETDSSSSSKAPSASLALWAEDNDISPSDLAAAYGGTSLKFTTIPTPSPAKDLINAGLSPDVEIGKYIAIDCEMVGVGPPPSTHSALARVSLVNYHGTQIYDSYVRPREFITDWRTHVSGITPATMTHARTFEEVQFEIASLIKGRILIGHAIRNDLEVLMLGHPKRDIRDTSRFKGFRKYAAGKTPGLKRLAREVLGVEIQGGEHSSVEDARATMLLWRRFKDAFEVEHAAKFAVVSKPGKKKRGKK